MTVHRFRLLVVATLTALLALVGTVAPAAAVDETESGYLRGDLRTGPGDWWGVYGTAQIRATNLSSGEISYNTFYNGYMMTLAAGEYLVEAVFECETSDPCIRSLYAGGTPFRSQAQIVTIEPFTETYLDFLTRPGGAISGTVTNATLGAATNLSAQAHLIDPATGSLTTWRAAAAVGPDGSYTITGVPAGDYLVRFVPVDLVLTGAEYWNDADWVLDAEMVTVADEATPVTDINGTVGDNGAWIDRFSGADRFQMAAGISRLYTSGVDVVFVTNGLNYPDALSAGPLGAAFGGPILLVTPTSVPGAVIDELERLQPDSIVVVGGVNSVGSAVYDQLAGYADHIERVAGADRFAASRNLVARGFDEAETVYVATGHNYPDALAAGAAAGYDDAPVLLVDGYSSSVDEATAELLADLGTKRVVVVGGPLSVKPAYLSSLYGLPGVTEVARRSGHDRFSAAAILNQETFPVADTVMLATGLNFPDALAGGPLAGAWDAPIYLVQPNCVPVSVIYELVRLQPRDIIVLGGPASVGQEVMDLVPCGAL